MESSFTHRPFVSELWVTSTSGLCADTASLSVSSQLSHRHKTAQNVTDRQPASRLTAPHHSHARTPATSHRPARRAAPPARALGQHATPPRSADMDTAAVQRRDVRAQNRRLSLVPVRARPKTTSSATSSAQPRVPTAAVPCLHTHKSSRSGAAPSRSLVGRSSGVRRKCTAQYLST